MSNKIDVAYARYSDEGQNSQTIEVQFENCERAAGQPLVHYKDEAISGTTIAGRPEFQRLLRDAAAGKIKRIWVNRYDRLGRDEAESFTAVAELEDYGCEVISVQEGRDKITRGIHLVMSAHYTRELSVKTRDGLLKTHELRNYTGGPPPYGMRTEAKGESKILVVDPEEAKVVKYIFDAYTNAVEPLGLKTIAKALNDRGIPTRSMQAERAGKLKVNRKTGRKRKASTWSKITVRSIIENPIYTGLVIYNRRTFKRSKATGRRTYKRNDSSQHKSYRDDTLRIISDDQFQAANGKLAVRKTGTRGNARGAAIIRPFTGHLFCDQCGSAFYSRKSENAKGVYFYMQCGCRQRKGPEACSNTSLLREDKLLASLKNACSMVFDNIDEMVEAATAEAKQAASVNREDASRTRAELSKLDAEISRVTDLLADPDLLAEPLAKKAILRKASELEAKREELHTKQEKLIDKASDDTEALATKIRAKLEAARDQWSALAGPAHLNALIGEFVGPSMVTVAGELVPVGAMKNPSQVASTVRGVVAGGGFEPPTSGL